MPKCDAVEERARWLARHALPHEAPLRAWLSSRRLPGLEIDDVVQETYARLIQAESLETVRNSKAYMFQTAWSVLVTHVRRERVVSMQTLANLDELGLETEAPGPEQQVADRDELRRLAECLADLPGNVGEVMRLRRVHGLSQREVAQRLRLAESTVEKHMRRGFLLLLERFNHGGYLGSKASKMQGKGIHSTHEPGRRKAGR